MIKSNDHHFRQYAEFIRPQDLMAALGSATPTQLAEIKSILFDKPSRQTKRKRPPADPLLTLKKAAECLGVSRTTIWRMVRDGRLPALMLPQGTRRIKESSIEAILQG